MNNQIDNDSTLEVAVLLPDDAMKVQPKVKDDSQKKKMIRRKIEDLLDNKKLMEDFNLDDADFKT